MKIGSALRCLPAILAIIGIVLLPFVRVGIAMPAADRIAPAHAAMTSDADAMMPSGMPCCPDETPQSDCGKDCPLMGLCMASCLQPHSLGSGLVIPIERATLMLPGGDRDLDSLAQPPPPRPPKT